MDKLSRLETFVNCGFAQDPFTVADFQTGDGLRIARILSMGVKGHAMVSIIGDRGCGKTRSINAALAKMDVRPVNVRSADKSRLLISDIEQAMIMDLSDEKPARGREVRARQLRRILGEASSKKDVVVMVEECHRLHPMTLRALKTLREMDWMGKTELFSIVLVGQSDPMNKPGVSEVRLRSDSVFMKGLTREEVAGYIRSTVGRVFEEDAIEILTGVASSNFLEIQDTLVNLMGLMLASGKDKVDAGLVEETLDMGKKPIPRTRKADHEPVITTQIDKTAAGSDALKSVLGSRMGGPVRKVVNG